MAVNGDSYFSLSKVRDPGCDLVEVGRGTWKTHSERVCDGHINCSAQIVVDT